MVVRAGASDMAAALASAVPAMSTGPASSAEIAAFSAEHRLWTNVYTGHGDAAEHRDNWGPEDPAMRNGPRAGDRCGAAGAGSRRSADNAACTAFYAGPRARSAAARDLLRGPFDANDEGRNGLNRAS